MTNGFDIIIRIGPCSDQEAQTFLDDILEQHGERLGASYALWDIVKEHPTPSDPVPYSPVNVILKQAKLSAEDQSMSSDPIVYPDNTTDEAS